MLNVLMVVCISLVLGLSIPIFYEKNKKTAKIITIFSLIYPFLQIIKRLSQTMLYKDVASMVESGFLLKSIFHIGIAWIPFLICAYIIRKKETYLQIDSELDKMKIKEM